MDGNLAALNEHLARQEDIDYENEWKFDYVCDCIDAAMYGLELEKEFKSSNGISRDLIDVICELQGNGREVFNDILFQFVFRNNKDLQENIQDYLKQELETWVDADEAYEQHVKDNEPQEP